MQKFYEQLDLEEDPFGKLALKKIDLRVKGSFCYDKGFNSPKEADNALTEGKQSIKNILLTAKEHQIQSFTLGARDKIKCDVAVAQMPAIRINANIAMRRRRLEDSIRENQKLKLRNVDAKAYLTTRISPKPESVMLPSGLYDPPSSRLKFSKENSDIRMLCKTVTDRETVNNQAFRSRSTSFCIQPLAVTTGAEFYRQQAVTPSINLVKNNQNNIQLLRLSHLDQTQASNNSKLDSVFTPNTENQLANQTLANLLPKLSINNKRFSQPPVAANFFQTAQLPENSMLSTYSTLRLAHQSSPRQTTYQRPEPKLVFCWQKNKKETANQFVARPAEDVPRNALTDKLTRGIQNLVQRLQKREGFRVKVTKQSRTLGYLPKPRECGTLTNNGFGCYLIGGLCAETISEVSVATIESGQVVWQKIQLKDPQNQIKPRQCHSTVSYQNKLFIFGGCFNYNRKRQVRETTNQIIEINTFDKTSVVHKTNGMAIGVRKNHTAVTYKKSMVVFGGTSENGFVYQDMLCYNFEQQEMTTVQFVAGLAPEYFYQGGACAVIKPKSNQPLDQGLRKSDEIREGIYYFGGRAANGELVQNKIKYFKPKTIDGIVVSGEFQKIRSSGQPPCQRSNHAMVYLPVSCSILICGGRSDVSPKENGTQLLNDIYLYLLDQKVWIKVKLSFDSDQLDYFCNLSISVVSDGSKYEQIIIFGGLTNQVLKEDNQNQLGAKLVSGLTNNSYLLEIKQRPDGESIMSNQLRGASQFV